MPNIKSNCPNTKNTSKHVVVVSMVNKQYSNKLIPGDIINIVPIDSFQLFGWEPHCDNIWENIL